MDLSGTGIGAPRGAAAGARAGPCGEAAAAVADGAPGKRLLDRLTGADRFTTGTIAVPMSQDSIHFTAHPIRQLNRTST